MKHEYYKSRKSENSNQKYKYNLKKSNNVTKAIQTYSDYSDLAPESKLEGRNTIIEAINANREFNKAWYLKPNSGKRMDPRLYEIVQQLKANNTALYPVDRKTLDKISSTKSHQGIIAQVAAHSYASVNDILEKAANLNQAPFLIILDQIQDSQNLGAIMRSADAAGVHGIIIPKRRSVLLDSAAAKTSVGAIEHVLVARVNSLNQTISELKDKNIWICGLDIPGENIFKSEHLSNAIALIIGNEGNGISNSIKRSCDFLLEIPMYGKINSLNASNAAAIAMYAVNNKRVN